MSTYFKWHHEKNTDHLLALASTRTSRIEGLVCLDPVIRFCGSEYGNDLVLFISLSVIVKPPFPVKAELIDVHLQCSSWCIPSAKVKRFGHFEN